MSHGNYCSWYHHDSPTNIYSIQNINAPFACKCRISASKWSKEILVKRIIGTDVARIELEKARQTTEGISIFGGDAWRKMPWLSFNWHSCSIQSAKSGHWRQKFDGQSLPHKQIKGKPKVGKLNILRVAHSWPSSASSCLSIIWDKLHAALTRPGIKGSSINREQYKTQKSSERKARLKKTHGVIKWLPLKPISNFYI